MAEAGFGWLVTEAALAPSAFAVAVAYAGSGGPSCRAASAADAAMLLPDAVVRAHFMRLSGTIRGCISTGSRKIRGRICSF